MKRKTVFLTLFIIGIILIFNITNYMLIEGFSDTLGIMQSSDKRVLDLPSLNLKMNLQLYSSHNL